MVLEKRKCRIHLLLPYRRANPSFQSSNPSFWRFHLYAASAMRPPTILEMRPKQLDFRNALHSYIEKKHVEPMRSYAPAHPVLNIRLSLHKC